MGAPVGLLRGGGAGTAGVRRGRRAQAAGEETAHERGGRSGPHQAAAGCGHRGKSQSGQRRHPRQAASPSVGDSQAPSSPGFHLQISRKPRWEQLPVWPNGYAWGLETPVPSCYCTTLKNGPFVISTSPTPTNQVRGLARGLWGTDHSCAVLLRGGALTLLGCVARRPAGALCPQLLERPRVSRAQPEIRPPALPAQQSLATPWVALESSLSPQWGLQPSAQVPLTDSSDGVSQPC